MGTVKGLFKQGLIGKNTMVGVSTNNGIGYTPLMGLQGVKNYGVLNKNVKGCKITHLPNPNGFGKPLPLIVVMV